MKSYLAALIAAIIVTVGSTVFAEPMTKEQGDATLEELQEIKQLLKKQQPQAQAHPGQNNAVTIKIKQSGERVMVS